VALFATPQEHAANPPESWVVVKRGPRSWALTPAGDPDVVLDQFETKRSAEQARTESFLVKLYRQEARWYAGEPVPGWRPYAP
jgi:hypothetical protein